VAEANTIRRPAKPQPTYIGPVIEQGAQWGFHFYQPALNANTPIWFAQPTKAEASKLRNQLGKQPQAFLVTQPLLEAIRQSITEAQSSTTDPEALDEEQV
jgi:hypothetical protein